MQTTAVWTTLEISLESNRDHDHPFLDVDASALFTGPDGRQLRRPAFWDGGRTWRLRFAPTTLGRWTYHVTSNDPSDSGLNGVSGELEASDPDQEGPEIFRHGFLRPAGRHLSFDDGTPFFWLGDTHWRFVSERWDEANKEGWTSQFKGMVDRRVEQGFTVYQTNLVSFDGWAKAPWWEPGEEFRSINVDFFTTVVDPRMDYIAEAGLVNALGLAWYPAIDRPEAVAGLTRLAGYLVARYGSLPMVWTLGGEVAGYDPDLRASRIDRWREVAQAITASDDYAHPRTAHLTNERPIPGYFQHEDWLTLTLNQLGHGDHDMSPSHYREFLARQPDMPLVEGEALYEGIISVEAVGRRPVTDTMVRQVAYRAMQSGCCGYTYGAQGCWNNAWDRTDGASMWGDLPWFDGIDLPGAPQLGHLRRFYESVGWEQLHPDSDCFVTDNMINAVFNPPLLLSNGSRTTVVAYFGETYRIGEGGAAFAHLPARFFSLRWFNPRSGDFSLAVASRSAEHGILAIPDKPDSADWLLVAKAVNG